MSINGDFTEFSFTEIIQFLQDFNKTGLLTLSCQSSHFFWSDKGQLVAASWRTDGLGLYYLILQLKMVRKRSLQRVIDSAYNNDESLGYFLRNNGFLSLNTLAMLFEMQVLKELYAVEREAIIGFQFDKDAVIPTMELTGLSLPLNYLLHPHRYRTDYTRNYILRQSTKKKSRLNITTRLEQV